MHVLPFFNIMHERVKTQPTFPCSKLTTDSFCLTEEIFEQGSTLTLDSLDVDSLFTNMPLNGTADICINQIFAKTDTAKSFRKSKLSGS